MLRFRFAGVSLLAAFLCMGFAPCNIGFFSVAFAADAISVRPEIGKPLQAAQEDVKQRKYKEALAKIHEAEAVGDRTPYETYMIDYMRGVAAQGAGENELAARSYEAVLNSGNATGPAQANIVQALADLYFSAGNYPKAIVWLTRYANENGDDPRARALLTRAYYWNGDYARAGKELQEEIQANEKAGQSPSEEQLQMLASCAIKQNDKAGYLVALEQMVTYHPKKEFWADLLNRLAARPGFAQSRLSLDIYRLRMAVGAVTSTDDFMNMAELALQANYPFEAKKIIEAAYKSGAFGNGNDAPRQKRLQELTAKSAADDMKALAQTEAEVRKSNEGTGMVNVGFDYVTAGQPDKGIALMEQGIAKGGLKHPDEAKLHLALAYLQADNQAKALQIFKSIQGSDGTAELAHYWSIAASRQPTE